MPTVLHTLAWLVIGPSLIVAILVIDCTCGQLVLRWLDQRFPGEPLDLAPYRLADGDAVEAWREAA